jgi:predicted secreted protein
MNRSRRILITCHCVLNANAKVYPLATERGIFSNAVSSYIEKGCGLFQLPCPELSYIGMNRWGMTKEQYDHPNFRVHCRDILRYPMVQLQAFVQAGYELVGILGMDGSPNCGVTLTCEGYRGGELCPQNQVAEQVKSLRFIPGKGVFMEEFLELLRQIDLQPELFAIREKEATD